MDRQNFQPHPNIQYGQNHICNESLNLGVLLSLMRFLTRCLCSYQQRTLHSIEGFLLFVEKLLHSKIPKVGQKLGSRRQNADNSAALNSIAKRRGEIGRASCRERVQISVVAVSLKQKNTRPGATSSLSVCYVLL